MVLGQTPTIIAVEPEPLTLPSFEPVSNFAPLQASQSGEIFSPGASLAINAVAIGGAILLAVLVMRGLRK